MPAGGRLFSVAVGFKVPYAATIRPRVRDVVYGRTRVDLPDRRRVRNHLRSIHAVALAGLGELTANMALMSTQPASGRWIVRDMRVEYLKKGRGTITAECQVDDVAWDTDRNIEGVAVLRDQRGNTVARVHMSWKVGPRAPG